MFKLKRTFAYILTFLLTFTLCPMGANAATYETPTISALRGAATVMKSGGYAPKAVYIGMEVGNGDIIISGANSSLKINYKDKEMLISENTKISINEIWERNERIVTAVVLVAGTVKNKIDFTLPKNSRNEIRTSNAVAGVRGTEYVITYDRMGVQDGSFESGFTRIMVLEGVVRLDIGLVGHEEDTATFLVSADGIVQMTEDIKGVQTFTDIDELSEELTETITIALSALDASLLEELLDNPHMQFFAEEITAILETKTEQEMPEKPSGGMIATSEAAEVLNISPQNETNDNTPLDDENELNASLIDPTINDDGSNEEQEEQETKNQSEIEEEETEEENLEQEIEGEEEEEEQEEQEEQEEEQEEEQQPEEEEQEEEFEEEPEEEINPIPTPEPERGTQAILNIEPVESNIFEFWDQHGFIGNKIALNVTGGNGTGIVSFTSAPTDSIDFETIDEVTYAQLLTIGESVITAIKAGDNSYNSTSATLNIPAVRLKGEPIGSPSATFTKPDRVVAVEITATNQSVEYAIADNNSAESLIWQTEPIFNNMPEGVYYVYARTRANTDYTSGTISISSPVTVLKAGSEANPFIVTTDTLQYVGGGAANPDAYKGWDEESYYLQSENISLAGWTTIPSFNGSYDANNLSISGLTDALFGELKSGAEVFNLSLNVAITNLTGNTGAVANINSGLIDNINVSGSVTGGDTTGGIAGENNGIIRNCTVPAAINGGNNVGGISGTSSGTISRCYATGGVSGSSTIGGISGRNNTGGLIERCYVANSVTGTSDSIGGISGRNESSTIKECRVDATVSGNQYIGGITGGEANAGWTYLITDCYTTGSVTGNTQVGGIVGRLENSEISNCYVTGAVQANGTSFRAVGGIAGGVNSGSTAARINNCLSLNASLTGGESDLQSRGRISGYCASWYTPSNNYARSGLIPPADNAFTENGEDAEPGTGANEYNQIGFYNGADGKLSWDFSETWGWGTTLPHLRWLMDTDIPLSIDTPIIFLSAPLPLFGGFEITDDEACLCANPDILLCDICGLTFCAICDLSSCAVCGILPCDVCGLSPCDGIDCDSVGAKPPEISEEHNTSGTEIPDADEPKEPISDPEDDPDA